VVATSSIADRPRQRENSRGANHVVRSAVKNYWANTTSASCAKDLVLDAPGPSSADDPARGTAGCGKSRSKENTGMNVPWSSVSQEFFGMLFRRPRPPLALVRFLHQKLTDLS
jgi:hypothetical protein